MNEKSEVNSGNLVGLMVYDADPIGQGALSTVYKGTWGSRSVAVKRLAPGEDGVNTEEAEVLSKLSHENVLKYFDSRKNPDGTVDLVIELASGVTLATALCQRSNLTTSWKRSTIYQVANGLAYLHSRGVIHLNLEPPNILFRDRNLAQVLISDFSMARLAVSSRLAGAQEFRAPDFPFTQKSDVFSLASIACCVLSERNPGSPDETKEIVSRVLKNMDWYPNWHVALRQGVKPNQNDRITAAQFRDIFERPPYSLEVANQADGNASTARRSLALVAVVTLVVSIIVAFLIWFLLLKKGS